MLTTQPSAAVQKKDLHIGGVGTSRSGALSAFAYPPRIDDASWLTQTQGALRQAEEWAKVNPRPALVIAAMLGVAVGLLFSRQA